MTTFLNSKISFILTIFLLNCSSAFSFGLAPRRVVGRPTPTSTSTSTSTSKLNMAWGLQKLGQPVISINNSVTTGAPETGALFGRKHVVTNGNDERGVHGAGSSTLSKEQYYDELTSLDTNFRKQSLLMGLTDKWSSAEKIQRIEMASTVESLLPASFAFSSSSSVVQVTNLKAGGLTKEWDFEF